MDYTADERALAIDVLGYVAVHPALPAGEIPDYGGEGDKILFDLTELNKLRPGSMEFKSLQEKIALKAGNDMKLGAARIATVLLSDQRMKDGVAILADGLVVSDVRDLLMRTGLVDSIKHLVGIQEFFSVIENRVLNVRPDNSAETLQ